MHRSRFPEEQIVRKVCEASDRRPECNQDALIGTTDALLGEAEAE